MKKNYLTHKFELPSLGYTIKVFLFDYSKLEDLKNEIELDMEVDKIPEQEFYVQGKVWSKPNIDYSYLVLNKDFLSNAIIAHEVSHIVDNILVRLEMDKQIFTEFRARVTERIFDEIDFWLKKKKESIETNFKIPIP